jgi:hypothetical protein
MRQAKQKRSPVICSSFDKRFQKRNHCRPTQSNPLNSNTPLEAGGHSIWNLVASLDYAPHDKTKILHIASNGIPMVCSQNTLNYFLKPGSLIVAVIQISADNDWPATSPRYQVTPRAISRQGITELNLLNTPLIKAAAKIHKSRTLA